MFFRKDAELHEKVFLLETRVEILKDQLVIQETLIKALMKAYPNGINKDGSPRKKMGRKTKVEA